MSAALHSWLDANQSEVRALESALRDPEPAQTRLLLETIAANADTDFGRVHGFGGIGSAEDFRQAVPLQTWEDLEPWIARIAAGEPNVLTNEPVAGFEETSGSSGAAKLIPFTSQLSREFERTVICWLSALQREFPQTLAGPAYWSLSPPVKQRRTTAGGLPVGFDSDLAYFSREGANALAGTMAVSPDLAKIRDADAFFDATIRQLLDCRNLALVSVWSPVFFLRLDEVLCENFGKFATWREIWPKLALLSCWADAQSAAWIPRVQERLGDVPIQGKGLLSTEGVVSVPIGGKSAPVLALTSHFFEFVGGGGQLFLAHELEPGKTYEIVLTTGGGLYRYRTGDRIFVEKSGGVRFVGRLGCVSDLVGEKLSEAQAVAALESTGALFLAATERGYMVACAEIADLADLAEIERRLCANPYYGQARALGQLGPLTRILIPTGAERKIAAFFSEKSGCALGDVKIPALFSAEEWAACAKAIELGTKKNEKLSLDSHLHACTFMQMNDSTSHLSDARFFKALSDPNRLRILESLCGCQDPQSVTELGNCCDVDLSVLSRHLAQLRDAGVVSGKKDGRHTRYTANVAELAQIFRDMADALEKSACHPSCCSNPNPNPNPNQKGTKS